MTIASLHRKYSTLALIILNFVMFLVLFNLLISAYLSIHKRVFRANKADNPIEKKYGSLESLYPKIYPNPSVAEIRDILQETWRRHYAYEPFTQFREGDYQGRYVNVSADGYRNSRNQGPWPPSSEAANIFVFGGSTTFGYGVTDDETIPSHLQRRLQERFNKPLHIYNFGRGHYYSSQELILFQRLISKGFRPDAAIFIDGLNDFFYDSDLPLFTDNLSRHVSKEVKLDFCHENSLPVCRLLRYHSDQTPQEYVVDPLTVDSVIQMYRNNKQIIEATGRAFAVPTLFVWQPVPGFKYDLEYHYFSHGITTNKHKLSGVGYQSVETLFKTGKMGENFVWCAGLQENLTEPLYLDMVHYTSAMADRVANCIVHGMEQHLANIIEN